jgi:hypothetical protein
MLKPITGASPFPQGCGPQGDFTRDSEGENRLAERPRVERGRRRQVVLRLGGPGGAIEAAAACAAANRHEAGQRSDVLTFPNRRERRNVESVPSYLVETYLARGQRGERAARELRARSAADELTTSTTRVGFERSIHVPEDELCFFVFDAPSGGDAAVVAQGAGLEPTRVVEAISSREEEK